MLSACPPPRGAKGAACAPGTASARDREISGFPPPPQREGYREVLRGERARAGSDVRERRSHISAAALLKSVLNVTPRRNGSRRNTPLPAPRRPPRPFPWKLIKGGGVEFATEKSHLGLKQFQAFLQDRSCPSRGRGGGRQGDL